MKGRGQRGDRGIWHAHLRWIEPGLNVKRWVVLLAFGVLLFGLGGATLLRNLYPMPSYFYYLTLQFVPRALRTFLLLGLALLGIGGGLWGLNRSLLAPYLEGSARPYTEVLYDYRRRGRGPRVVVLGGGHGQSTTLRALKAHTSNLTAIVTVADDGGSSGRLRRELGVLPPGDFRNCIAALADDESLVTRLLQYRFTSQAGLDRHSFGNLFISAMAEVTGSFESALRESSRVLAVQGYVLPCTLEGITLVADVQREGELPTRVRGESQIPGTGGTILRVALEPARPRAYPKAVQAILTADMVVVGPGSLYTSILPNLLVPEIGEALRASAAPKVFVTNIVTQPGETDGYTARQHLEAMERHLGPGLFSTVIVNIPPWEVAPPEGTTWVEPDLRSRRETEVKVVALTDDGRPWLHDSRRLGEILIGLLD